MAKTGAERQKTYRERQRQRRIAEAERKPAAMPVAHLGDGGELVFELRLKLLPKEDRRCG